MVVFCLSDSKSPQAPRTLLSILADPRNAVVWIASILPLIFNPSYLFLKSVVTVSSASTSTGITFTIMFHSIFFFALWQSPSICVSFRFYFHFEVRRTAKSTWWQVLFSYELSLGLVVWLGLDDSFVSQNFREFHVSYSIGRILVCAYITG